ncbi:single-stranded DNA-binding protein [Nocardioides daeguensis]|uniref:Single-stranded DNA-binding protein n=1 Tax=Nocardioides daeguensis TaxID=908359 RepID=A0ABP6V7D8_9ACTN|nr:single-stranded DNA-binding protein [Nocardioides daeguensis]MBV6729642.1 single-stranded DNA-binding protein [Nocardioides daeguensis]MCR1774753.1 single-stranded DNA-binding protein [Nocardioides daeguensis]
MANEHGESCETANVVRLSGRLAADPEERVLPSGDRLWTCRVVVPRAEVRTLASGRKGPSVDVIDLAGWSARVRRSMRTWHAGDVVGVEGALRRRFYRAGGNTSSRMEVEVTSGRLLRRAVNG